MPIATLIAADSLLSGDLDEARDRLVEAGLVAGAVSVIDEGKAADLRFDGDLGAARTALAPMADAHDIVVQGDGTRRKKLLISDMDSTMITIECIDELADYAGLKEQISAVTERAMRGELDFVEALKGRVALLAGLGEDKLAACLEERVMIMPGAETLVKTMRGWGAHCVLVSGGFTHFTAPVAERIGFHGQYANRLAIEDGKLTGEVEGDIVDSTAKKRILSEMADEYGLAMADTLAVGDGANDIPMIETSGLGIAYHAKEKARAAADAAITHNDLTALLYAQGLPKSEWAEGN